MNGQSGWVERHHKLIIAALASVIVIFLVSCLLHDTIPICHYIFGCDHRMHVAGIY